MFCAACGAISPDTAPCCGNCGAPLAGRANASTTSTPGAHQQFQFAPIAHSPFSDEPLPQPSDSLPQLRPAGDILTFTPFTRPDSMTQAAPTTPPAFAKREIADYPTETHVPTPTAQFLPDATLGYTNFQPNTPSDEARPLHVRFVPAPSYPQNHAVTPPGNLYNAPVWEQEESYVPMFQAPQPLNTPPAYPISSNDNGEPDESFAAMFQVPPLASPSGNFSVGPVRSTFRQDSTFSFVPEFERHAFTRPLPIWASLLGVATGALLLIALVFLNPDWATGALIAGTVAIILAILLLIAGGVRVALGMLAEQNPRRGLQVVSSVLLVLLLFLTGGIAITQQSGLHGVQARYLEGQHSWQVALNEYQAAGEKAPTSDNLARVYNEWGEELSKQQHYADAVERFSTVLQSYSRVRGEFGRARTGLLAAYLAWGDLATHSQDYAGATSHYDALLASSYCDPGCQSLTLSKDATAYYRLAEQQFSRQQYASAVNAFKALVTRFASSPEAGQIHAHYAQALWGLGQQQLNTTCSNAVKTYQQIARQFADTSWGKQAATALAQPVTVKGRFTTSLPGAPYNPTAALVQGLTAGIQQYQFPPLLRDAPITQIHSDGTFTFTAVPQGKYELIWSSDGTLHFYYASSGNKVLYTANLGPLCTYNYGDIAETIPTPTTP